MRAIAARAGVSPGLVVHHFGTKDALRAECDAEVLRRYASQDRRRGPPTDHLLEALALPGIGATLLVYMLRVIHAGGPAARDFLERPIDDTRGRHGARRRQRPVRPSRDEEARLRYLTYQTMGALLIEFRRSRTARRPSSSRRCGRQLPQHPAHARALHRGLLTSRELLDEYLRFLWSRRTGARRTPATPHPPPPEPTAGGTTTHQRKHACPPTRWPSRSRA